jgi:hypothetical protein
MNREWVHVTAQELESLLNRAVDGLECFVVEQHHRLPPVLVLEVLLLDEALELARELRKVSEQGRAE